MSCAMGTKRSQFCGKEAAVTMWLSLLREGGLLREGRP